ncbi:MAG: hypothetical protein Q8L98_07355 [Chlamydiales bacterium]|nr:hypothetical protein [Chlamydiales bacterium]
MISSEIEQSSLYIRQQAPGVSEEPCSEDTIADIAQTCFSLQPNSSSNRESSIVSKKIHYQEGSIYIGQRLNSRSHGQGLLVRGSEYYEGNFENGAFCGYGISINRNTRIYYKGGHKNSQLHGQGILIKDRNQHHEGAFKNGYYHGIGTRFNPDGTTTKGLFVYGQKINSHLSEIGNADFIGPLFSLSLGSASIGNVLGVLIDVLNRHDEYRQYGNALSQIHQRLQISPSSYKQEAEIIHHQLTEDGQPQLLLYGIQGHTMLVYLTAASDGEFINCEIFNSGTGLKYHERKDGKFQTMLRVKAEKEKITKETIETFLNYLRFQDIKEPYQAVFDLGQRQKLSPGEEVCQAPQKDKNCAIECLFAFLRNKMPAKDYYKLRWLLFKTCIEEAKKSAEPETQRFLKRYWKEINAKLKKKYEKHCQVDPSALTTDEDLKSCQISEEELLHLLEKIQSIGFSAVHYPNGSCYQGQVQNGKAHGLGRLSCANGDLFEGQFVIGQLFGVGRLTYANGFFYEGELLFGKPDGFGTLIDANKDRYQGEFILGRAFGYGKLTYANGDCFEGEFFMGKPSFGHFTSASNEKDSYRGSFDSKKSYSAKSDPNQPGNPPLSRKRKDR